TLAMEESQVELSEADKQAIEARDEVAPKTVIARIPASARNSTDFSLVEFVATDRADLDSPDKIAEAFASGKAIEMQDDSESFGLCGGGYGGCGGCGGGCGGGGGWGIVEGAFWGIGSLIGAAIDVAAYTIGFVGETVVYLADGLLRYNPVFFHEG